MKTRDLAPKNETLEQKIEHLKKGIVERDSTIEKLIVERDSTIEKLIVERDSTILRLTNELIALRRRMFGRSSERFILQDPNQLSIAFEGEEILPEEQDVGSFIGSL